MIVSSRLQKVLTTHPVQYGHVYDRNDDQKGNLKYLNTVFKTLIRINIISTAKPIIIKLTNKYKIKVMYINYGIFAISNKC